MVGQRAPEAVARAALEPADLDVLGIARANLAGALDPRAAEALDLQVVRVLPAVLELDDRRAGNDLRAGERQVELLAEDAQPRRLMLGPGAGLGSPGRDRDEREGSDEPGDPEARNQVLTTCGIVNPDAPGITCAGSTLNQSASSEQ
jgi:hypothetical protein